MSAAKTSLNGTPSRRCTTVMDSNVLTAKYHAAAIRSATNPTIEPSTDDRSTSSAAVRTSRIAPDETAAITKQARSLSIPYHGTRPRNSRRSNVPAMATSAIAVGPPRNIAATSGAKATDTIRPLGSVTGRTLATNVSAVQKMMPWTPPISGRTGQMTIAAASIRLAAATVVTM